MMKYRTEHTNTVSAEYGKEQGNPFLEALPELLGKAEFSLRFAGTKWTRTPELFNGIDNMVPAYGLYV